MVKRRDAHIRLCRQPIDAQVFGVLALDVFQHAAYQTEMGLPADQRQQCAAAGARQHLVEDFTDNLLAKNARVQRTIHDVEQPFGSA